MLIHQTLDPRDALIVDVRQSNQVGEDAVARVEPLGGFLEIECVLGDFSPKDFTCGVPGFIPFIKRILEGVRLFNGEVFDEFQGRHGMKDPVALLENGRLVQ